MKIFRIGNGLMVCATLLTACSPAPKEVEPEVDMVKAIDQNGTILYLDMSMADYSSDKIALQSLIEKYPLVVVDFYAEWCGPCKSLGQTLERVAGKYSDIVFIKVNIDKHQEIASDYKVRSIPVVAFFKNGQKVYTQPGAPSASDLSNLIQRYLR